VDGHHLGLPAVYAEKSGDGGMVLRRGYDKLLAGKRVLVVEDVLNTGGSIKETITPCARAGGRRRRRRRARESRRVTAAQVGAPALVALLDVALDAWDADACPLCRDGVRSTRTSAKAAISSPVARNAATSFGICDRGFLPVAGIDRPADPGQARTMRTILLAVAVACMIAGTATRSPCAVTAVLEPPEAV
jgi:hypothetical protein